MKALLSSYLLMYTLYIFYRECDIWKLKYILSLPKCPHVKLCYCKKGKQARFPQFANEIRDLQVVTIRDQIITPISSPHSDGHLGQHTWYFTARVGSHTVRSLLPVTFHTTYVSYLEFQLPSAPTLISLCFLFILVSLASIPFLYMSPFPPKHIVTSLPACY